MRHARIISTGSEIPERVVTNAEFAPRFGASIDDWLVEKVGIRERRFMREDQVTSDLAVAAGRAALERAGLEPLALDRIIVATDTPDYLSPATAAVVQAKLGARRAGVFDVNSACAGWVIALDLAARLVITEPDETSILVIGAYGMSRFLDGEDKKTATLFADGAGAVVVGAGAAPGWLATVTAAAGEYHDALGIYTGGTFRPATAANLARYGSPVVQFVRKFPATFNTEQWPPLIERVLDRASATTGTRLRPDDVDHY
jgi:3-oxoacyl-[acyl-carrier-protein] synthase-3